MKQNNLAFEISKFYKSLFGDKFTPYRYQIAVAEKLLEGKNVILSVPTGAGKTWASIIPFLLAQANPGIHFPKKMIYNLPLRGLANSIYEDVEEVLRTRGYSTEEIKRQTGEYSDDKYFEKKIIFSTIDQTLSNFLCFPLPLSPRQANINAGALIGSYLVFDEFHLLDEKLSMQTTLGCLRMLRNLSRCCIMTATLSDEFMMLLKENLPNYEIVTLDDFPNDKLNIGSLKPKYDKKKIKILDEKISFENILKCHKNKTIIICNRVETVQKLYRQIQENLTGFENLSDLNPENIICLHSRFFDKDRKEKENRLKNLFGKNANKESAILISTQAIEAGMDISCEVMHTEISPISSFLQRAGRCARFSGQTGNIYIYDIINIDEKELLQEDASNEEEDKREIRKINNLYLPYEKIVCEKTQRELQKYTTLDGDIPKLLIKDILKESKEELYQKFTNGSFFNSDKIKESWNTCKKNNYRNTIRDIQSVEIVLISDNEIAEVEKFPFKFQSLGMYKWSLVGWLNKIVKSENYDTDDWLVKKLEYNSFVGESDNDEDIKYQLTKISDFTKLTAHVFVNAKYLGYSSEFGFNWEYTNTFYQISPEREWTNKKEVFKPLEKDTFYQHNKGLIGAFEKDFLGVDKSALNFIFIELSNFIELEISKEEFIKLINLMIILHDYGKLNEAWQKPMQSYQALKENIEINNFKEILAHTDYDDKDERDRRLAEKVSLHKRPSHAGVGAYVAQEVIEDEYLKIGVSLAIARHHSPISMSYPNFNISDINYNEVQNLLEEYNLKFQLTQTVQGASKTDIDGFQCNDWENEQLVYMFFVRILRLCDQKATENLKEYL